MNARLAEVELFAWIGEDELGSGVVGIKQGFAQTGFTALVATKESKMQQFSAGMNGQAAHYGKKIYLCRFECKEVIFSTTTGVEP